jgi:hypothetical protein
MKVSNLLLAFLLLVFLPTMVFPLSHFTFTANTGNNGTTIISRTINPKIGTNALTTGDEIGVFTPAGLCVGAVAWPAAGNISITVWGDNDQTPEVDGIAVNETINFRIWDTETNTEYSIMDFAWNSPFNGKYNVNFFASLSKLNALLVPDPPVITNPLNNSVGNTTAGNLTWNAAIGATSYDYVLADNASYTTPILNGNTVSLTVAYTGLTNGIKYYLKVRGKNAVGDGPFTESQFFTKLGQVTLVSPADNAKARPINGTLSWNSVSNATSYDVYLSTDNTFAATVPINVNGTTYDYVGLNYFTNYFWKVLAKNGTNTGDASVVRTFKTVVGKTVITSPTNNQTGVGISGNGTWTAVANATYYRMEIATDASFTNIVVNSGNIAGTTAPFSGLLNFTNYFIRVFSGDPDGETESDHLTFRTVIGVPVLTSPADNATGQPISGSLVWGAVTGATSYDLLFSTDNTFTDIVPINVAGTTSNYSGLLTFTPYFWKVRAKSADGDGNYSTAGKFTTSIDKATITNPTNNQKNVAVAGNITWNAVAGADSYRMELAADNAFTNIIASATGILGTSTSYSGLINFTDYFVRVFAVYSGGETVSDVVTFRTIIGVPVLTSPADNATAQPLSGTLTWGAVTGATSYDVLLSTDNTFAGALVNNVAGTTFNYSGLTNFTSYFWKARAKSADGDGAYSAARTFITVIGKPSITNPTNNQKGVATSGNITWVAVPGADTYRMELASDVAFTNIVSSATGIVGTSTPYSGLNNCSDYFVRVYAVYVGGEVVSDIVTFKTILGVPTNISPANNAFAQQLAGNLQCSNVNCADSYDFQIATDAAFVTVVSESNVAGNIYAYNGLLNNTKYYFHARAKNTDGTSAYSAGTAFTTLIGPATLVSPPNNAVNVNPLTGSVTWNSPAGASIYRVQISTDNTFASTLVDADGLAVTNYTYSNLSSKTQYFFRVYAYSGINTGTWSAAFNFTTGLSKVNLLSPANNFAGAELNNVSTAWSILNGAATYKIIVSENANLSSPIINQGGINVTNFSINGLGYNKTYYWAVCGQDINGDGPFSDTRSFGTKIDKPTLNSPANNATDVALEGQMKWNAASGAETYQIQVSLVNTFVTTVKDQSGISGTTYNYTDLQNDKDHFWRVRGVKGGAPGEWSDVFTFKTMNLPAPVLVSPANNKKDVFMDVKLDWDPVANASNYNVRIATDIDFTNIVAQGNDLTLTEMNVTGLFGNGRDYFWQAQAKGTLGISNWSAPFKFTTILDPVVTGNETPCASQDEIYSSGDPFAVDDNWTVTGGSIVGSSTDKTVTVHWGTGSVGTVKLTRSSAEWGSYTDNKTLNISIQPQVNVGITINADHYYTNMICLNEEVLFTPTLDNNGIFTYSWTINNVASGTGTTLKHRFTATGQYVINLSIVGDNCKSGAGTITINITDECPVTVINDDFETCKNSSPTIFPTVFGGKGTYSYIWEPNSDFVDYQVRNATVKSATFSKQFKFSAIDVITDEITTDYIYMSLFESPSISFNKSYLFVSNGDAVDLTNEDVIIVNVSGGASPYQFRWTDNEGITIDPTSIYPPYGSSKYYLTVTDANGCISNEKRLIIFRSNGKDNFEEIIPGMTGVGFMYTYPNPVTENVNVFADFNNEMPANMKIFNLMGKEVFSMTIDDTKIFESQINVSSFTAGVYTIVISTSENTFAKQFVKQ